MTCPGVPATVKLIRERGAVLELRPVHYRGGGSNAGFRRAAGLRRLLPQRLRLHQRAAVARSVVEAPPRHAMIRRINRRLRPGLLITVAAMSADTLGCSGAALTEKLTDGETLAGNPPPPRAVREEWGRRVVAEYRSAAHTHALVGWMIELGLSPDLIRMGLRIVDDELRHAELSAEVLHAAGGALSQPVDRATLVPPRAEPLDEALTLANLELFCLGETVAVPLFRRMLLGTTRPVARRVIRTIVADEARHRRFGWLLHGELTRGEAGSGRRVGVAQMLPRLLGRVREAYGLGRSLELAPELRAWGLLAPGAVCRGAPTGGAGVVGASIGYGVAASGVEGAVAGSATNGVGAWPGPPARGGRLPWMSRAIPAGRANEEPGDAEVQNEVPRAELAGLRGLPSSARRHHGLVRRGRHRCLERTAMRSSRWPAAILRSRDRHHADAAKVF